MKKCTQLKCLGATLALVLVTQGAMAADAGKFYVGADVGLTRFSGDGPSKNSVFEPSQGFKDSDSSYGLHIGFQFTDWFASELGYTDFGSATDKFAIKKGVFFIVSPNDTQTVNAQGVTLAGVFSHNLSSNIAILGALGVSSMRYKSTVSGGFSPVTGSLLERHSFSDQGLVYGVGAKYTLSDSVSLRVDLRRNDVGDFRLDNMSIGLEYSF